MLISIGLLILVGLVCGLMFERMKLPRIIGLLLAGVVLGPFALNWLDSSILEHSADLRKLALMIILIKAGLTIRLSDFKHIGRPAILLSFVPALFELVAYTLLAPLFFNISYSQAALLGSVMAAVSPAVVVPRMVNLIEEGVGQAKKIPQLILAGASFDDVVVIVLFTSLLGMGQGAAFRWMDLFNLPISILLSILLGLLVGVVFVKLYKLWSKSSNFQPVYGALLMLSLACFMVVIESTLSAYLPLSGLLAILVFAMQVGKGVMVNQAGPLSRFFSQTWLLGEIVLFVLVGALVDIRYASSAGLSALFLVLLALVIRTLGVWLSIAGGGFTRKEKLFCVIAYLPKATVQAAIGGIPLSMGMENGQLILSVAVLGILVTAPLGATLLDRYSRDFLEDKKEGF